MSHRSKNIDAAVTLWRLRFVYGQNDRRCNLVKEGRVAFFDKMTIIS